MPKIRINEVDNTSAGTPGRYGNYAVLITGYTYRNATSTDKIHPDENGVYEFSSKQDFLDTIGELAGTDTNYEPDWDIVKKGSITQSETDSGVTYTTNITEYHYGYRMTRELLNLGYQVIYRPITKVSDMNDEKFWEIFKDKASYDFRFVSHGMLETCYDKETHTKNYNRLVEIENALANLAELEKAVGADGDLETAYNKAGYKFKDNEGLAYDNYEAAKTGLVTDKAEIDKAIEECNSREFTRETFNNINGCIAKLASFKMKDAKTSILNNGRGDCTALIELDEDVYCEVDPTKRPEDLIIEGIEELSSIIVTDNNGEYCALTVPSVYYVSSKSTMKMPGAFHYLACFMGSLGAGFAEWYAAAGYTRGVSSYVIDHTSVKLGEIAINALEPRNLDNDPNTNQPPFACNVIANFRGSYYLWGNRTAAPLKAEAGGNDLTAKHFLNIRQLCSTIKKQLYVSCRRFTFDPNSDTLWINFVNSITPTLDAMKADQGIRDYKIVKVYTDKKATLKAKVRIIPIEAVEDFDLEVSLEDSFGETIVTTA